MNSWRKVLTAFLICAAPTLWAAASEKPLQTEANVIAELTFTASRAYSDPFNEVTLDAIFIDPQGRELRGRPARDAVGVRRARRNP